MIDLTGKNALITGSTTGIGEATAVVFARLGANVIVSGRDGERGATVVNRIRTDGGKGEFLRADLLQDGAASKLAEEAIEKVGRLHILVNNAGILYTANVVDTTDDEWRDLFNVNVFAIFQMCRTVIAHMREHGGGTIVNTASEWGLNGEPNHIAYCASKAAVVQMTRCMALDHAADNIRVNAVCPGEIHTQMVDDILSTQGGSLEDNLKALAAGIPMRRLASPEEVANCMAFLACDKSSYVTGASLTVDGGNDATAGPYPG